MKTVLVLAAMLIPGIAAAQSTSPSAPYNATLSRSTGEYGIAFAGRLSSDPRDTPTMKRQKRDRALALRAEAQMLLEQDGGTLTREHDAYLRREARDILGY